MPELTIQEQATIDAIKYAKQSEYGVTAVKIELEVDLNRGEAQDECADCDGRGDFTCDHCDGDYMSQCNEEDCENEDCDLRHDWCDRCNEGREECNSCDGSGTYGEGEEWGDEDHCLQWILERLEPHGLAERTPYGSYKIAGPLKWAMFYRDGSVDSELTATILLDKPENALLVPIVAQVFKDFAEMVNPDYDVTSAGMHMAWLNHPEGKYGHTYDTITDEHKVRFGNFNKSMNLLMPALYFLGAPGENSREMHFRQPGAVSEAASHGRSKFYAVNYAHGAIEYRVFDTCYDRLDAILDNLQVMSRTLRYWTIEYTPTGMAKITPTVRFGTERGNGKLTRFYRSTTHLDLLNAGLERLKPKYLTITELKKQRKFDLNRRSFHAARQEAEAQAKLTYQEYAERYDWQQTINRHEATANAMNRLGQSATPEQIEQRVLEVLKMMMGAPKKTLDEYITEKMTQWQTNSNGEYTLMA